VLPAVASTRVEPGLIRPSFSAASIMERATRSLMEPPGFWLSSLRKRRQGPVSKWVTSTRGVAPIRSRLERGRVAEGARVAAVSVMESRFGWKTKGAGGDRWRWGPAREGAPWPVAAVMALLGCRPL